MSEKSMVAFSDLLPLESSACPESGANLITRMVARLLAGRQHLQQAPRGPSDPLQIVEENHKGVLPGRDRLDDLKKRMVKTVVGVRDGQRGHLGLTAGDQVKL
jgi:hypothetical protein